MGKPNELGKSKLVYFNIRDESKEWEFANSGTDNFSKWVKDKIREHLGIRINEEKEILEILELSETVKTEIKEEVKNQIKEILKNKNIETDKPIAPIAINKPDKYGQEELVPKQKEIQDQKQEINKSLNVNRFLDDICQSSDE